MSDVEATSEVLDEVSEAPLSIVIVGVGEDDFGDMQFLDERKSSDGCRDLTQFVEMNAHKEDMDEFTSAALSEIPNQLVDYFQSRGIDNLPPVTVEDEEEIVVAPFYD